MFAAAVEEKHIPLRYHTERLRNQIRDDLERFAADGRWRREGFIARMEEDVRVSARRNGLVIAGKIDRLDTAPDGRAYVVDYKYSNPQKPRRQAKDENLLQAPLYLMAAEQTLARHRRACFYVGLKGR